MYKLYIIFTFFFFLPACSDLGSISLPSESLPSDSSLITTQADYLTANDALDASIVYSEGVPVSIHPGSSVINTGVRRVAFGFPLPKNRVENLSNISVFNQSGTEMPIDVKETARWRSLSSSEESIRSVRIVVDINFDTLETKTVFVKLSDTRTSNLTLPSDFNMMSDWVQVSDGEYPLSENVYEPAVYATLPAEWLGTCLIRSKSIAVNQAGSIGWYDTALVEFSKTAVNDVSDYVTPDQRIDYVTQAEPWLFDRASTLYGVYIRTGELKWLKHAHRAAQFYSQHINANGYFDLKPYPDLKYSYGQPMLFDLIILSNEEMLPAIEKVANAGLSWNEVYTLQTNFWTERHQTYALLAALSAWEANGLTEHAERVSSIVSASMNMVNNPVNGWAPSGCMQHTLISHEGGGDQTPVCSPWMSALFADAITRYYIHSEDVESLSFLSQLGDYITQYGTYDGGQGSVHLAGYLVPWYLASSQNTYTDSGVFADLEHTCDVSGLLAKSMWAKLTLGEDITEAKSSYDSMVPACQANLDNWHRVDADINYGKAVWRLSPARKYNWWFGTAMDMTWIDSIISN